MELPNKDDSKITVLDVGNQIEFGKWYWYDNGEEVKMGCVTHIGSNYAKLRGVTEKRNLGNWSTRVHFDDFWECCEPVEDPQGEINERIEEYQQESTELMGEIQEITRQLGVETVDKLPEPETQALATQDVDKERYKEALVEAKDERLPELFDKLDDVNESLSEWMKARAIPMQAKASRLRNSIDQIEDRIFSVELYAGLTEKVEQIREGEPASADEKVTVFQRRHYMDEECLARYETGGMDFQHIEEFDEWLCREENRERLLPFPRCVVAFRVRRNTKRRPDIHPFVRIALENEDRSTYLYIRNGENIYRLTTDIEFGEKLFPDMGNVELSDKMWGRVYSEEVKDMIPDRLYQQNKEEWKKWEEIKESEKWKEADWGKQRELRDEHKPELRHPDKWTPFTSESVYFDDMKEHLGEKMQEHNRMALVLQGLFDRSPVFHPHPPVELWTEEGLNNALELKYDSDRALQSTEEPPDFEEYKRRCNDQLEDGSVTIGQQEVWLDHEGDKRADQLGWRHDPEDRRKLKNGGFWPAGDPGPGDFAEVAEWHPQKETCEYQWYRKERDQGWVPSNPELYKRTFEVDREDVFNVSAYKPGDFKMFFNDPRTRQEYLKWAPILLEAEEYHAGNREARRPLDDGHEEASDISSEIRRLRRRI